VTESVKTVRLRRYFIKGGEFDAFLDWWEGSIAPLRRANGFTVEAAFADRANDEFVWAVSAAGDQVAFAALEQEYNALPSRAKAFYGVPQRVDKVVSLSSPCTLTSATTESSGSER
jgi:hypothetical protein